MGLWLTVTDAGAQPANQARTTHSIIGLVRVGTLARICIAGIDGAGVAVITGFGDAGGAFAGRACVARGTWVAVVTGLLV